LGIFAVIYFDRNPGRIPPPKKLSAVVGEPKA